VPDWTLVERETIQRLERVFRLRDFAEALSFTNRVGALAEGHHTAILTEWGQVTVTLWTQDPRSPPERFRHGSKDRFSRFPQTKRTAPVPSLIPRIAVRETQVR
jgi:hypothetical protein